jgi:hypothetical protein
VVVGGASLSGGRASVVGAVIGALIVGVLRNALAQIPGGTFADRLILGGAVLVIVVMDRVAGRREGWRAIADSSSVSPRPSWPHERPLSAHVATARSTLAAIRLA